MQRHDYSRVLREVRDLPEDIGRLISQYKTPGEVVVELLDILGPHYHTGSGFTPEGANENYINQEFAIEEDSPYDPTYYNLYLDLSTDGFVYINSIAYRLSYDLFRKKCQNGCEIHLDINKLKALLIHLYLIKISSS